MALAPSDFWRFRESRGRVERVEVTVRPLDQFDLAPDILKVDVEGTEDDVIAGAREMIEEHLPIILLEGSAVNSQDWLSTLGYEVHRFNADPARFVVGEAGDLNSFFLTPRQRDRFLGIDVVEG